MRWISSASARLFVLLVSSLPLMAAGPGCVSPVLQDAGRQDPLVIGVVPFPLASGTPEPPVDVAEVIRTDLAATGRIAPLKPLALPERPKRLAEVRFEDWRRVGADFILIGLVAIVHDGGHEVEFRLVDTRTESNVVGFVVPSGPDQLEATARRIARIVDDELGAASGRSGASPSTRRAPPPRAHAERGEGAGGGSFPSFEPIAS